MLAIGRFVADVQLMIYQDFSQTARFLLLL